MSKSSDLDKVAKAYLISCIDASGYDGLEPTTDAEKVQFLYTTFVAEYGWNLPRLGLVKALAEYFAGLPPCCTIAFTNVDVLEQAKEWGSLPADATERQEQAILDNWFNFAANKTAQLFRAHVIDVKRIY
jgi:hypothetical protein